VRPMRPPRACPRSGWPGLIRDAHGCPYHPERRFRSPSGASVGADYYHGQGCQARRQLVLTRDGPTCHNCGAWGRVVDHIVPRSQGGSTNPRNLQVLCLRCSATKSGLEGKRAQQS
jgi:HNH endonuclease